MTCDCSQLPHIAPTHPMRSIVPFDDDVTQQQVECNTSAYLVYIDALIGIAEDYERYRTDCCQCDEDGNPSFDPSCVQAMAADAAAAEQAAWTIYLNARLGCVGTQ